NARLFARTDFDRYRTGDPIAVRLHALTVPPVRIARTARLAGDGETLEITSPAAGKDGCIEADALTVFRMRAGRPVARGEIVLSTCARRGERTPETVRSNPLAIAE